MPEYKSRINVRVRIDQQDWKKLADIKTKEEWKLDESVEEIFIIARGGFKNPLMLFGYSYQG